MGRMLMVYAGAIAGVMSSAQVVAVDGLDGPLGIGAGITFLGFLAILFTLLVNALMKTGTRSDSINEQLTADKNAEILRLIQQLESERVQAAKREADLKEELDMWYRRATGNEREST